MIFTPSGVRSSNGKVGREGTVEGKTSFVVHQVVKLLKFFVQ